MDEGEQAEVRSILEDLRPRMARSRAAQPLCLYHHTHLTNAASIIAGEALLSRAKCAQLEVHYLDSADPLIIESTPWTHDFARLYFRPRTPTHYWVEGIIPKAWRRNHNEREAHCPLMVMLAFDAAGVLTEEGVMVTSGSAASSGHQSWEVTPAILRGLPYADIFHDGALPERRKQEIKYRRQTEVLCPDSLSTRHLRAVVCRTAWELGMLQRDLSRRGIGVDGYEHLLRLEEPGERLFERKWTFLEDISLTGDILHLQFHLPVNSWGAWRIGEHQQWFYDFRLRVVNMETKQEASVERLQWTFGRSVRLRLPWRTERVAVHCTLDADLVYAGSVSQPGLV